MPGRRLLLVGLLAGLACARPAPAQDTASVEGTLRLACWRGSFLGRGADGQLGLLAGPDGSYRVEVAEGQAPLATLLDRRGRGWTLVLPARGEAIAQPWDREWRKLEADLGAGLRAVAAALAEPDAPAGASRRVVLPPTGPARGFRAAAAFRGRGRGGPGEVLTVVRRSVPAVGGGLAVRSSRRPGNLVITGVRCLPVAFAPQEAFVPLWPLRELLELRAENPGTCPPPGG